MGRASGRDGEGGGGDGAGGLSEGEPEAEREALGERPPSARRDLLTISLNGPGERRGLTKLAE